MGLITEGGDMYQLMTPRMGGNAMNEKKKLREMLAVHEARNTENGGAAPSRTMAVMEAAIRRALKRHTAQSRHRRSFL